MKTAISIPNDIFERAESLARKMEVSRSELYTEAIRIYLKENHIEDVTAKLDEVYKDTNSSLDKELLNAQTTSLPKEEW